MTGPSGLGVGMTPTSHMLRDLQGGIGGGNSGNGSTTNTGSSNGGPNKVSFLRVYIHLRMTLNVNQVQNIRTIKTHNFCLHMKLL